MSSLSESCSCGASLALNGGKYGSTVVLNYQAQDFRAAHAVCRLPTVGRCGVESQHPYVGDTYRSFCALPHGHEGWHRDDKGMEWTHTSDLAASSGGPLDCPMHGPTVQGYCAQCDTTTIARSTESS